ncbi:MAG: NADH-quinone oxidoreductase subunit NuoH [Pirellulaceae bacterium]|nr:NADH-quinone oxidoreductase subunit NuoH [Pirellulaceae bacterium]
MGQFFNNLLQDINAFLWGLAGYSSQEITTLAEDSWIGYLLAAIIQAALLLHVLAAGTVLFTWAERKVCGRIQDRLGPTRVGGKFGWLQSIADGIKLLCKEDLIPDEADSLLFRIAPYLSISASFAALIVLPFSDGWVAQQLNIGAFFILAIMGLEVFGVILAGYASGSKWSLYGAMREAAQVISYEIPLAMCVVVPVLLVGSMNLGTIANYQAGWFTNWLIFHDPFAFATFWIYFTCGIASVNRAPFDLAEAESELVAGFHTEYSGMRWSLLFMAEYGSMFTVSGLGVLLFLGAWYGPLPIFNSWTSGTESWYLAQMANLVGCLNFVLKSSLLVIVMIWVRWTLPRLRIDQVMTMCLKYCVPLSLIGLSGVLLWQLLAIPSLNDLAPARSDLTEHWAEKSSSPFVKDSQEKVDLFDGRNTQ